MPSLARPDSASPPHKLLCLDDATGLHTSRRCLAYEPYPRRNPLRQHHTTQPLHLQMMQTTVAAAVEPVNAPPKPWHPSPSPPPQQKQQKQQQHPPLLPKSSAMLTRPLTVSAGGLLEQQYSVRGKLRDDIQGRNAGRLYSGYRMRDWAPVVVKLVRNEEEAQLQHLCAHAGVVAVLDVFRNPRLHDRVHRDCLAVVLEYATGGDLLDLICASAGGTLPEPAVWNVARQSLRTLVYLHTLSVCHRDIKPDNIFIEGGSEGGVLSVKLGDFEFATAVTPITKSLHTLQYMAPEVYDNFRNPAATYTMACDVWSLGATLFVAICGHFPFKFAGHSIATLTAADVSALRAAAVSFSGGAWETTSPELITLVRKMLTPDARQRPTADECLQLLQKWQPDTC